MKSFFILCGIAVALFFADAYFENGKYTRVLQQAAEQMRHSIRSKLP